MKLSETEKKMVLKSRVNDHRCELWRPTKNFVEQNNPDNLIIFRTWTAAAWSKINNCYNISTRIFRAQNSYMTARGWEYDKLDDPEYKLNEWEEFIKRFAKEFDCEIIRDKSNPNSCRFRKSYHI